MCWLKAYVSVELTAWFPNQYRRCQERSAGRAGLWRPDVGSSRAMVCWSWPLTYRLAGTSLPLPRARSYGPPSIAYGCGSSGGMPRAYSIRSASSTAPSAAKQSRISGRPSEGCRFAQGRRGLLTSVRSDEADRAILEHGEGGPDLDSPRAGRLADEFKIEFGHDAVALERDSLRLQGP